MSGVAGSSSDYVHTNLHVDVMELELPENSHDRLGSRDTDYLFPEYQAQEGKWDRDSVFISLLGSIDCEQNDDFGVLTSFSAAYIFRLFLRPGLGRNQSRNAVIDHELAIVFARVFNQAVGEICQR